MTALEISMILGPLALVITAIGGIVLGVLQLQTKKTVDNTHNLVNGRWSEMATQLVAAQERYMASEARYDALVNKMQRANDLVAEAAALALLKAQNGEGSFANGEKPTITGPLHDG